MKDYKAAIHLLEKYITLLENDIGDPLLGDEIKEERKMDVSILKQIKSHLIYVSKPIKYEYYQDFVKSYHEWHLKVAGISPRMNAASGKAMKEIINYLMEQSKEKTEKGALAAWNFILLHWERVSPFLQQQKSLLHINKNLTEILDQIRNGHHKAQTGTNRLADIERELRQ